MGRYSRSQIQDLQGRQRLPQRSLQGKERETTFLNRNINFHVNKCSPMLCFYQYPANKIILVSQKKKKKKKKKNKKIQIHYHTQMDTVPVLIPSQAAVL